MAELIDKKIRCISVKQQRLLNNSQIVDKKRVCAYCRVSTGSDEQFGSYELQCEYYKNFINKNTSWGLVDIYADQGKSGTSVGKRENFLRMINDCRTGKIDMIITKSISRFARNTVDCLQYIHELQDLEHPVEIFFEKENIYTLDKKNELLLTILSSLAQDESRSTSENIKWAIKKRYQEGIPRCPTEFLYGYSKNENREMVIIPDEAVVIQRIYSEYLSGMGASNIAKELREDGIMTVRGGVWHKSSVLRILKNEKYCGDVMMQKVYTPDYLTHIIKPNRGEISRYFIENHHPAIISREIWNAVQSEINKRRENATDDDVSKRIGYSTVSVLSNTLFCGYCGQPVIRKTQYITREDRKIYIWQCRAANKKNCRECGYERCRARLQYDEFIKTAFMDMLFKMKGNLSHILSNEPLNEMLQGVTEHMDFNELYYKKLIDRGYLYDEGKVEFILKNGIKSTATFTPHYMLNNYRKKKVQV